MARHMGSHPPDETRADVVDTRDPAVATTSGTAEAKDRFGGFNWGSCFFGWLVAVAIAILLTSIVGAIAAAVGSNADVTQSDAQRQAGTIGLVSAIVLLAVLLIGYYTGGDGAGGVCRFRGAPPGVGGWAVAVSGTVIPIAPGGGF